jgi:hypothetical protein
MSAALEPEADPVPPLSETGATLERQIGALPPIDLATLEAGAALLTRVDRKYVVRLSTFERLVDSLDDHWRALQIDDRRLFGYSSTYFDTADLHTYRAHLQRRRRRFKVRVRQSTDSDSCMLEVKRKGLRGVTVKERRDHAIGSQTELGEDGRSFVEGSLGGHGDRRLAERIGAFGPVVVTGNRRTTLACLSGHSRLTIDTDLVCGWGSAHSALRPGMVVLESKVEGHASQVDRLLRSFGVRPVPISKYCLGVASLGVDLPSNPWRRTMRSYFHIPGN